jgi:choline dehydrogenase-like flavoprotein
MKRAIVVGSGAGGATVAKELQGRFAVTVLEAGRDFRRCTLSPKRVASLKRSGLLFDARAIGLAFPAMRVRRTREGMILVNGVGLGGTTTVATGNALRVDADLRSLGIDLDVEFADAAREIPISTGHERAWRATTRQLFAACASLGLEPRPTPKMGAEARCRHCGRCVLGCPWNAKWDSRAYLDRAVADGAEVVTGCRVERVAIVGDRAVGVEARVGLSRRLYRADLVIVAAGGFGTPVILQNSGLGCEARLFVDPVVCVAAEATDCRQCYELQMPFIVQRDGYLLSPYFDDLSFCFNRAWRYPAKDIVGIMVKLADDSVGRVTRRGVEKSLSAEDRRRLDEGVEVAKAILHRFGVAVGSTFLGTLNAGHPGGALPLTAREAETFHHDRLPDNLYVADATLLPHALGSPAILTLVAMAKRVARRCAERHG